MSEYIISINQLADFSRSTDKKKQTVINQQQVPNKFLIPYYQKCRAGMKEYFKLRGEVKPILEAIDVLTKRIPKNNRQRIDRQVSIEALERFLKMKLPEILFKIDYEILKPKDKILTVDGVDIIVAPDIIVRGTINGQNVIGGIKIHISKNKPFDLKQGRYVASTIYKYLNTKVKQDEDIVMPELCFCLDVFGNRLVPSPENITPIMDEVTIYCQEIKSLWNAA